MLRYRVQSECNRLLKIPAILLVSIPIIQIGEDGSEGILTNTTYFEIFSPISEEPFTIDSLRSVESVV